MRNTILAAAACVLAAATCLCLTFGGCRDRPVSETSTAVVAGGGTPREGCVEIGRDPSRVARLDEAVRAVATVNHAETGWSESVEVDIMPGTWLLPASAFEVPETKAVDHVP